MENETKMKIVMGKIEDNFRKRSDSCLSSVLNNKAYFSCSVFHSIK